MPAQQSSPGSAAAASGIVNRSPPNASTTTSKPAVSLRMRNVVDEWCISSAAEAVESGTAFVSGTRPKFRGARFAGQSVLGIRVPGRGTRRNAMSSSSFGLRADERTSGRADEQAAQGTPLRGSGQARCRIVRGDGHAPDRIDSARRRDRQAQRSVAEAGIHRVPGAPCCGFGPFVTVAVGPAGSAVRPRHAARPAVRC
jgi:hypothetical protein